VLLLVILACHAHHPAHGAPPPSLRRVGLSAVQFVHDVPAPVEVLRATPAPLRKALDDGLPPATLLDPERDGAFLRNEYTGVVQFGGGFVREGDVALETRARYVAFAEQQPYADLARNWLHEAVQDALDARGIATEPVTVGQVPLTRVPRRGSHPDDGVDNVNLPRLELTPGPIAPRADGPEWIVVPLLRAFLAHNGGWFRGQTHGCMAGARIDALVVLYDARRGTPVWWHEATGRHMDERTAQATRAQLEDYILEAQADVSRTLRRRILR
jgi:hypothetical protein